MLKKRQNLLLLLSVIALLNLLGGCNDSAPVFYAAPAAASQSARLLSQLQEQGIKIIQIGDTIQLILPADQFFHVPSTRFNTDSYATLNKIAQLLLSYAKVSIKVAAYTDNTGSSVRNQALSQAWAQNIAKYLWRRGVDTRILYAEGYGAADPVAANQTLQGRALNRRIEITLRILPPDND